MTLKIEITVPAETVEQGKGRDYVANALHAIGHGAVNTTTAMPAEAADEKPAEAKPKKGRKAEPKQNISTGEERKDPADTAAQDAEDEKAEAEGAGDKPLAKDDVAAVMQSYIKAYGLPATQEDGPKIFKEALGTPPAGEDYWKLSILPYDDQDKIAKVIKTWKRATDENPLKRERVKADA